MYIQSPLSLLSSLPFSLRLGASVCVYALHLTTTDRLSPETVYIQTVSPITIVFFSLSDWELGYPTIDHLWPETVYTDSLPYHYCLLFFSLSGWELGYPTTDRLWPETVYTDSLPYHHCLLSHTEYSGCSGWGCFWCL